GGNLEGKKPRLESGIDAQARKTDPGQLAQIVVQLHCARLAIHQAEVDLGSPRLCVVLKPPTGLKVSALRAYRARGSCLSMDRFAHTSLANVGARPKDPIGSQRGSHEWNKR